jgi:chaperonin GroEL
MEGPLREIVTNSGDEPRVVLNKVRDGTGNFGYGRPASSPALRQRPLRGAAPSLRSVDDMIVMGILNPTKVTRMALQNASSIAGLMITTEAMVAEAPKKASASSGHDHGGGGMGGMDF